MTALAKINTRQPDALAIEAVLIGGDLARLTPAQRVNYYNHLCESLGLNPLSKPFEYLVLNGKTVLYARRDCTDQLRRIHKVSIRVVSRETAGDLMIVTTQASTPDGRTDESIGAVAIAGLKGEMLANALLKCDTKAKRRVTLSICGLGMLDESELDALRDARPVPGDTGIRISPHGVDEDGPPPPDAEAFEALLQRLTVIENAIPLCKDYAGVLALRDLLGSHAKQSQLTRDIQSAKERGELSPSQSGVLSKTWMRCNYQTKKLEVEIHPPDAMESFLDDSLEEQP